MESSVLVVGGIISFAFWFLTAALVPYSKQRPVMVVCIVWIIVNLLLPVFQVWLVPAGWVSYSTIFWWVSFAGYIFACAIWPDTIWSDK